MLVPPTRYLLPVTTVTLALATLWPASTDTDPHDCYQVNSPTSKSVSIKLVSAHGSHHSSAQRELQSRAHLSWDRVHCDHHSLHGLHHLRLMSSLVSSWQDCCENPRLSHHGISSVEHPRLCCSSVHCLSLEWLVQVSELPEEEIVLKLDFSAPKV